MIKKRHHVVLYTLKSHHLSDLAREFFRQNGAEFDEVRLDEDRKVADQIYQRAGRQEAPIAEIDGRIIVGYKPELYEILFNQGGEEPK